MAGDASEYRHLVDAGMGSISAVVATLPAAYTLGEARVVNGVKYRLMHNAGNSEISKGYVASPIALAAGAGPYSVTISTASKSYHDLGACVVVHATVPTANYFWGAVRGEVGGMVADTASAPTGSALYIAANGQVALMPQSVVTGVRIIGFVKTTVSNGGAANGTARVFFE